MRDYVFPKKALIIKKEVPPIVEYFDNKEVVVSKDIVKRPLSKLQELHKRVKSNMTTAHTERV